MYAFSPNFSANDIFSMFSPGTGIKDQLASTAAFHLRVALHDEPRLDVLKRSGISAVSGPRKGPRFHLVRPARRTGISPLN